MSRIVIVFLSFLFLIPQGLRATPQLQTIVISKVAPSTTSCTAPPLSTTFSTTDAAVYTYFEVTGVSVDDTFIVAFYGPSGDLYSGTGATFSFAAATTAGSKCYPTTSNPLLIAGNQAANMPGTWTVAIFYNNNFNTAFFAGTFTITASGSTGGPTVVASSDPGSVTTNPFYYTNLASLTSSPMLSNFDARDIFGGTFTGASGENGHAIFADSVPSTGYYSLQFQTKTAVQLTGYTLYLADDGTANPASRSATGFTFLAGTSPGALSVISQRNLATRGSSYYNMLGIAPVAGMSTIKVTDAFAAASTYQYFEIRFTPNSGTYPGVRVMELVGTGPSGTGACTYSLSSGSASVGAGAGSNSFNVTAGSGCTWTATSNAPSWLTTSSSGNGSGTVNYTVTANTSASSRAGTITVGGQTSAGAQTFAVTQAGTGGGTATGYWQYIKTDSGIQPYSAGTAYPDTHSGAEGNFTVTITEPGEANYGRPIPTFGANFIWSRPPATLIPGTALSWPVSATVVSNAHTQPPYLGLFFIANMYPYQPVSNLTTVSPWAAAYLIAIWPDSGLNSASPVGTVFNYNNATLASPTMIPVGGSTTMDANGQMTILTHIRGSADYYWSYIYQWVPPDTSCSYSLSSGSASVGAGAGSGSFNVTAGSGCTWTAASNAPSWLTTSSSGNGNGTVNYSVTANTSTSSRNGTITVGDKTFTVTQAGATASCNYSISPGSNSMAAQGGSSSFTVTAGSTCSWTASVSSNASSWLHSTSSGNGNGTANYTADANTSTVSRTGTIVVGSATFTLTQAGGSSATAPSIAQGGIVNAVSNRAGGIAQGSIFTIYGTNLGPAASWTAYQFPIPDTVNGVTVTIKQGSTTVKAYLLYVQAAQINAIMPSNAPLGDVQMTVTYNGLIGASTSANIVKVAFGVNSAAYGTGQGIIQNYNTETDHPFNTASSPAKPGQVEIIVGTGLGPITTPDNQSPPAGAPTTPVQVVVGGIQATVAYSGRAPGNAGQDQINFLVPANAPLGCSVPMQVSTGGNWSNTVRIAISADGKHCSDTFNPYAGLSTTGGKSGTLGLIRVKFSGQVDPASGPTSATLDLGFAAFAKTNPGTDFTYSPITNLPPPGTCASSNKANFDLGAVMGDGGSSLDPTVAAALDAGAQLTVTGGAGGATGAMAQTSASSPYMGLLGGILNIEGATVPPPFLDGGPFTISGPGGKDVGPFSIKVPLSPAIAWTNPPSTINRTSPLTLTWSGGDSTQTVVILAGSTDQTSKASGGFLCVAPAGVHSFTVPVTALADLIPTTAAPSSSSSSSPVGILGLMPMHLGSTQSFTAPGLDVGIVFNTTMTAQTVQVK